MEEEEVLPPVPAYLPRPRYQVGRPISYLVGRDPLLFHVYLLTSTC